ncbi:MAG: hypothetical protein ACI9UA_000485 [Pseudoalteromonas tetraodonis]
MFWLSIFRRFTLWPFVLMLALCATAFVVGEQYPITRFPMYDKFPDHTFYVYITDREGQPIPVHDLTGINTSKLKKPYDKQLNKARKELKKRKLELSIAERREAGEDSLRKLYQSAPPAGQEKLKAMAPLRLQHVWIFSKNGKSVEQPAEPIASFTPAE